MFHLSAWYNMCSFLIKILKTKCNCSSTASLQWNCTVYNFHQLWHCSLLRNTFRAGTSVCKMHCQLQIELWVEKALGKKLWTADPLPKKGHGDLWPSQGNAQGRSWWPQTFACLKCEHESPWVPLLGVPPQRHPAWAAILLLLLQQDGIILSIWTSKALLWETWGWADWETWCDWVWGM